ncbi:MAG: homocysteine S-methyltransferase family protein, partial [Rhodobacteraceae bacterium]|nr:homocysteine S-methyltransferase family protein [Paracoccaceae bacterium]
MHSLRLPDAPVMSDLRALARERIVILDGAMGTMIQTLGLGEADFSGDLSGGCGCRHHSDQPQQGNNDLLCLSQPQAIEDIHYAFAMAGADILETNTFSSTTIAQADYAMEDAVDDLNVAAVRVARAAAGGGGGPGGRGGGDASDPGADPGPE